MTSKAAVFLAMLSLGIARAPAARAQEATQQNTTHASYAVYVHGLHALDATIAYQIQPWGYGANATIHSVGLASWFLRMHLDARSKGQFSSGSVIPMLYESQGYSRGANRHVKITYGNGSPATIVVDPPETDRESVPQDQLPHSIDTLGGIADLLHTLSTTGRCDGTGTVFDGLRLTRMTFHGPVKDTLPTGNGTFYNGDALRCNFVGQQLAGFIKDSPNRDKMSQPKAGAAWFKAVEGFGLVPVRVEMEHPKLGHVTIIMQQAAQH